MFEILLNNYLLWLNILIPIAIGIYMVSTHQKYSIKEFFAQSALTTAILLIAYGIGYASQDIYTKSYLNSKVNKFVFEEEWTELVHYTEQVCTGSGNSRSCISVPRTRHDFHPDNFYITSDIGTTSISESHYKKASREFSQVQVDDGHIGQVSYGDGRTFEVTPNKIIPYVGADFGINYVYASKTNIIKSKDLKDLQTKYHKELKSYPEVYEDAYGNPTIYRVINSELIDKRVADEMNQKLSVYASIKGKTKEVNPLVHLTTADSREMTEVIKGHYKDAHKNDAVLVVSLDKNGSVKWIDSFGFTKNVEFFTQNRNIKDLNVSEFLVNINKYWKRIPMEEYKYLVGEIDIPWWYELMVVLLNLIGSFFLFRWMIQKGL